MRTFYLFQSQSAPDLRASTDEPTGSKLPAEDGPWALIEEIAPDREWKLNASRKVVAAAVSENGFFYAAMATTNRHLSPSSKVIASRGRLCSAEMPSRSAPSRGS